jgi:predicted dinucleotide-binding enzyme
MEAAYDRNGVAGQTIAMRIGIIGSGHIGSNIGRRAAEADHEVTFAFSRNPTLLETSFNRQRKHSRFH